MEEAAASKLWILDHHRGVGDAPSSPASFRMEDLPAEIQSVVMSQLPLKEAVRTSIVSKSWEMLWRLHCNLCFDGPNDRFDGPDDRYYGLDDPSSDEDDDTSCYSSFVDRIKMKRAKFINDEIQSSVMSQIPLTEAVRTSIVSKSWGMLWRFHCNLCFDGPNDRFDGPGERYYGIDDSSTDEDDDTSCYLSIADRIKIKQAKFIEDVNWVIQRHSGIGINKFSIRCGLDKEYFEHVDRWIGFAPSTKANIIDFDLKEIGCTSREVHHFPLEALDAQGSSFVQSLFLANVSVKPHSGICGFTILRRLVLQCVQIFGDFPGLLAKCSTLEDLEIIECSGMANLSIPHKLDKLQHLRIVGLDVQMVEFHVDGLAHFEYRGRLIPIVLHGCSKLEKATIEFSESEALGHAFTAVPIILPVKILNVRAFIWKCSQLQKLTTRPGGMFMHLRHMTCHITVCPVDSVSDNGVHQLAHCLDLAPQLETLRLDMWYLDFKGSMGEVVGEEGPHMRRHDHLKTVYMSGFRCYKAQIQVACCIMKNASALEHVTIEPRIVEEVWGDCSALNAGVERRFLPEVRKWAQLASRRFGKVITVLDAP